MVANEVSLMMAIEVSLVVVYRAWIRSGAALVHHLEPVLVWFRSNSIEENGRKGKWIG